MTFKFPGAPPSPSKLQGIGSATGGKIASVVNNTAAKAGLPSAKSLAQQGARSLLQGQGLASTADLLAGRAIDGAVNKVQSKLDRTLGNISAKTGISLGRSSIDKLISDPRAALSDLVGGQSPILKSAPTVPGGWMPLLMARPDPLMEFDWYPELPFGLPPEYVEEVQFSESALSTTNTFINGRQITLPESQSVTEVQLTLYEDRIMTASSWLTVWRKAICPKGTYFNYPVVYKKPIRLYIRDAKGKTVGQFCLHGCFPTSAPSRSLSSNNERVRLQISLACEWVDFEDAVTGSGADELSNNGISGSSASGVQQVAGGFNSSLVNKLVSLKTNISKGFPNFKLGG